LKTAAALKDGDVVVDASATALRHALCDPDDVARLLFAKSDVGVEHAEVKLADERQLHQVALRHEQPTPT